MEEVKPILSVKGVRCGYQNIEIIHGVSFDVFQNQKVCILGPNGCGKTTLLRAVTDMIPFTGEVTACGLTIGKTPRIQVAKTISLMSQINSIYFPYSVYETVMMGRYSYKRGIFSSQNSEDKKIVEESLKQTGAWELKDRLITELSGGQLQRVMLARVLAQSPNIILLDEPTNHLDLKYQIELMEYLNEWVKKGTRCVVSVLHDINMALAFADKILLMQEGKRVIYESVNEFPLYKLNEVYGMNIGNYMKTSLKRWNNLENKME